MNFCIRSEIFLLLYFLVGVSIWSQSYYFSLTMLSHDENRDNGCACKNVPCKVDMDEVMNDWKYHTRKDNKEDWRKMAQKSSNEVNFNGNSLVSTAITIFIQPSSTERKKIENCSQIMLKFQLKTNKCHRCTSDLQFIDIIARPTPSSLTLTALLVDTFMDGF